MQPGEKHNKAAACSSSDVDIFPVRLYICVVKISLLEADILSSAVNLPQVLIVNPKLQHSAHTASLPRKRKRTSTARPSKPSAEHPEVLNQVPAVDGQVRVNVSYRVGVYPPLYDIDTSGEPKP